jgi:hypothetical protein
MICSAGTGYFEFLHRVVASSGALKGQNKPAQGGCPPKEKALKGRKKAALWREEFMPPLPGLELWCSFYPGRRFAVLSLGWFILPLQGVKT